MVQDAPRRDEPPPEPPEGFLTQAFGPAMGAALAGKPPPADSQILNAESMLAPTRNGGSAGWCHPETGELFVVVSLAEWRKLVELAHDAEACEGAVWREWVSPSYKLAIAVERVNIGLPPVLR